MGQHLLQLITNIRLLFGVLLFILLLIKAHPLLNWFSLIPFINGFTRNGKSLRDFRMILFIGERTTRQMILHISTLSQNVDKGCCLVSSLLLCETVVRYLKFRTKIFLPLNCFYFVRTQEIIMEPKGAGLAFQYSLL